MPGQPLYVPILKGKEGEFAALETLASDVRNRLAPLIEVPAVPYDYANERPAKSLDEHVADIPARLKKCCGDIQFYLDLPWFEAEEHLSDGRTALEAILRGCEDLGISSVPVISRTNKPDYVAAAGKHISRAGNVACIRLILKDFEEEVELGDEVDRLISGLGLSDATSIDLVVDLEDLGKDGRSTLVARSALSMVPRKEEWRRIILAAASFPEDLSDVDAATIATLPRLEWDLWRALQRRPPLGRVLIFGDYAIAHPIPKEIDPRTMRMSANVRYTTQDEWLIVKGRNVRQYGFNQYFELSRILVQRPEYSGRDFSWGDEYIADCAEEKRGPGNATTWRKVGVNHHLTLVARELSKLRHDV